MYSILPRRDRGHPPYPSRRYRGENIHNTEEKPCSLSRVDFFFLRSLPFESTYSRKYMSAKSAWLTHLRLIVTLPILLIIKLIDKPWKFF
jgi:hypothetical protein